MANGEDRQQEAEGEEPRARATVDGEDALDFHSDPESPEAGLEGIEESLESIDWRVAESLTALRKQINALAPRRSTLSDGTIGDTNHLKKGFKKSDHNPHVTDGAKGVVTAMDITHDPANGCNAAKIAESLRGSRDQRIKYIIWNRKIAASYATGGAAAWTWRPYGGTNPHDKHVHISVSASKALYDSKQPWSVSVA